MTSVASLRDKILADPKARAEYGRLGSASARVGEKVEIRHAEELEVASARKIEARQSRFRASRPGLASPGGQWLPAASPWD